MTGHIFERPLDILVAFLCFVVFVVTAYTIIDALWKRK
jgi:hypothetical protein